MLAQGLKVTAAILAKPQLRHYVVLRRLQSTHQVLISIILLCFNFNVSLLGNVYIADECNHAIRKVTASTGVITTIAGMGSTSSSIGDGGAATSATLSTPYGVTLDASGRRAQIYLSAV